MNPDGFAESFDRLLECRLDAHVLSKFGSARLVAGCTTFTVCGFSRRAVLRLDRVSLSEVETASFMVPQAPKLFIGV